MSFILKKKNNIIDKSCQRLSNGFSAKAVLSYVVSVCLTAKIA